MKKYTYLLLIFSLAAFGQSSDVELLDKSLNDGWMVLDKDWKYQKGDNMSWAQPSYDDQQWKTVVPKEGDLNNAEDTKIAGKNEIVWFRKKIKVDSSFTEPIIFNLFQSGASEIFLDGKLLYTFGVVSKDPNIFLYKSAPDDIFLLPLVSGKEQLLAVRFATGSRALPLYNESNGIAMRITTISVLNSPDTSRNNQMVLYWKGADNFYISLGATILMSLLFFTLFLFFPKERINGYFALTTFFLAVYLIMLVDTSSDSHWFWRNFIRQTIGGIGYLMMIYCIYRIYDRKVGFWFWFVGFLYLVAVLSIAIYPVDFLFPLAVLCCSVLIFVLSIRALKSNRVAAIIFIACIGFNILYFASIFLFSLIGIDVFYYTKSFSGLLLLLLPLSIAMYLGYSFGQRSKTLELQLLEVKKLSTENNRILSEQTVTLEKEVTQRTADLNRSLNNLKATQSQLIQSEKLASLGQLAAGIAHEIKNPLNFVNNFSELNLELTEEIHDELNKLTDSPEKEEIKTLLEDVVSNQKKIHQHGSRADSIVKSMLLHSRGGNGIKEPADINDLLKEYVNLAFHGMRAGKKPINVTLDFQLDGTIPNIPIIMEDISRVILNLCNNAFDAMHERLQDKNDSEHYQPKLTIKTYEKNNQVVIEITDNALGIPPQIKDKILTPFFTTKKGTEGTGLGLSITNDIIEAHGGSLQIESKQGEDSFTTFKINLTT